MFFYVVSLHHRNRTVRYLHLRNGAEGEVSAGIHGIAAADSCHVQLAHLESGVQGQGVRRRDGKPVRREQGAGIRHLKFAKQSRIDTFARDNACEITRGGLFHKVSRLLAPTLFAFAMLGRASPAD